MGSQEILNPVQFAAHTSRFANILIAIEIGFEGSLDGNADVVGLLLGEFGQFHADFGEVQTGNFLVEMFGQAIDAGFVVMLPEFKLGEGLVGEGVAHHEGGVSGGAAEVH